MAKILKKSLTKVASSDANFIKRDDFKAHKSRANSSGAVTLIRSGNGYRTRLSTAVFNALENPESVDVLFNQNKMMICTAPNGNGNSSVMQGRLIYDTELAEHIMELNPNVDFNAKGSTHCGTIIQSQTAEDGVNEVIIEF